MGNDTFVKYIHKESEHNLQSPQIMVPFIMEKFNPSSVVDVGCGIGTFLHEFKKNGVATIVGLDGKWVNRQQLLIRADEFIETDLEQPIKLDNEFDLVVCLEVAEHLSEKSSDIIVNSLTSLGKTIIFSAATKLQGGQNHLNEQPFSYWKQKFESRGYIAIDFFRPVFWNNDRVQWWYKQNAFLLVHNSLDINKYKAGKKEFTEDNILIHPELYYHSLSENDKKCAEITDFHSGKAGNINFYIGLVLRKLGLKK